MYTLLYTLLGTPCRLTAAGVMAVYAAGYTACQGQGPGLKDQKELGEGEEKRH